MMMKDMIIWSAPKTEASDWFCFFEHAQSLEVSDSCNSSVFACFGLDRDILVKMILAYGNMTKTASE